MSLVNPNCGQMLSTCILSIGVCAFLQTCSFHKRFHIWKAKWLEVIWQTSFQPFTFNLNVLVDPTCIRRFCFELILPHISPTPLLLCRFFEKKLIPPLDFNSSGVKTPCYFQASSYLGFVQRRIPFRKSTYCHAKGIINFVIGLAFTITFFWKTTQNKIDFCSILR